MRSAFLTSLGYEAKPFEPICAMPAMVVGSCTTLPFRTSNMHPFCVQRAPRSIFWASSNRSANRAFPFTTAMYCPGSFIRAYHLRAMPYMRSISPLLRQCLSKPATVVTLLRTVWSTTSNIQRDCSGSRRRMSANADGSQRWKRTTVGSTKRYTLLFAL